MKNRPIYGVSTCPQTPVATSVNKPSFPLDVGEPQPSTSTAAGGDHDSKRNGNGFMPPSSRREKTTQNGFSDEKRNRSPAASNESGEKSRKRLNGEWEHTSTPNHRSVDKSGRSNKYDHHNHRRTNEEAQLQDSKTSVRKDQRETSHSGSGASRRNDHQSLSNHRGGDIESAGDRRRVTESQDDSGADNSSKRSSSLSSHVNAKNTSESTGALFRRGEDRHRQNSDKAPPPKQSSSVRSNDSGSKESINRHDRDRSEQRGSERYSEKKTGSGHGNIRASSPAMSKLVASDSSRKHSRSPADSRQRSETATAQKKTGDATTPGDKGLVQKRDQSTSEISTKKHGQSSLRLESLTTLRHSIKVSKFFNFNLLRDRYKFA